MSIGPILVSGSGNPYGTAVRWADNGAVAAGSYTLNNGDLDAVSANSSEWKNACILEGRWNSGKWSIDMEVISVALENRIKFGLFATWDFGIVGGGPVNVVLETESGTGYTTNKNCGGQLDDVQTAITTGDIYTIEFDLDNGTWSTFINGAVRVNGDSFPTGVYVAPGWAEYLSGAEVRLVSQQYAPSSGYIKLEP